MNVDTNAARDLCEELGYLHGSGPEIRLWMHSMADEIERLRARVLELEAVHEDASGAIQHERERLRALVEAVRDANAAASHGVLLTPGQEAAWFRLMEAL